MPYHVRVSRSSNPSYDETRLDLTRDELEQRFLVPYQEGRPIVIGGMTIPVEDIQRIRMATRSVVTMGCTATHQLPRLPAVTRALAPTGANYRASPGSWPDFAQNAEYECLLFNRHS